MTQKKKEKRSSDPMKELANRFLGKKCNVWNINSSVTPYTGIIKEITDSAILLDDGKKLIILNLEFIVSIEEYPEKKSKK